MTKKALTPERASVLSLRRSLRDALDTRAEKIALTVTAYERELAMAYDYAASWRARAKNAEVALAKELSDDEAREDRLSKIEEDNAMLSDRVQELEKNEARLKAELLTALKPVVVPIVKRGNDAVTIPAEDPERLWLGLDPPAAVGSRAL